MKLKLALLVSVITLLAGTWAFSQQVQDPLGWSGEEVVPPQNFYNPSNWTPNTPAGNTCVISSDDSTLHIKYTTPGGAEMWVQTYFRFDPPISLKKYDIFGFDLKGSGCGAEICHNNLVLEIKFENGSKQAVMTRRGEGGILGVERWIEKIFIHKYDEAFTIAPGFNWDSVTVLSLALVADPWTMHQPADSGTFHIRNFVANSIGGWERASALEELTISDDILQEVKENAAELIRSRQKSTGLLTTWTEDQLSHLYGQGMALKVLTLEGEWEDTIPQNDYAHNASKLARFLAKNQNPAGYWPRTWNSQTGAVVVPYEPHDSSVWMGDFPWIIIGLNGYYKKSCDPEVAQALKKGEEFLVSLIDTVSGQLFTKNVITGRKIEVTSAEAYAAAIGALLQIGKTTWAMKLVAYIDEKTWNAIPQYWNEAVYSDRVVLFANTWLAQLMHDLGYEEKSLAALSFAGKSLFTRGPGAPYGLDGIGPIATWYEGTLSYICAGGPGSNSLMNNLIPYINPDGSVPHYNDDIGAVAGIWAQKWASLDGTCWLYFAAARSSPFVTINGPECPYPVVRVQSEIFDDLVVVPVPAKNRIKIIWPEKGRKTQFSVKDMQGRSLIEESHDLVRDELMIDVSSLTPGVYYIHGFEGQRRFVKKFIVE